MNNLDMKNIIVLKELPSNIIDEAIVILKDNKTIEKNISKEEPQEYMRLNIINEAQNIITQYIHSMEKIKREKNKEKEFIKKYKKMKRLSIVLGTMLILSFFISFIK